MSLVQIFSSDECEDIRTNGINVMYSTRAIQHVKLYLASRGVTLRDTSKMVKVMMHYSSTKDAKVWHYDDVVIVNFIINVGGVGTKIWTGSDVHELTEGEGCVTVGNEGYTFLGMKPVLHCAPDTDVGRWIMKVVIEPTFDISGYLEGSCATTYDSDLYRQRTIELKKMCEDDMAAVVDYCH